MAADDLSHETFMAKMVQTSVFGVPLAGSINQRQIPGLPVSRNSLSRAMAISSGKACTNKTISGDGITIPDELHGFLRGYNLSLLQLQRRYRGEYRMNEILFYRCFFIHGYLRSMIDYAIKKVIPAVIT